MRGLACGAAVLFALGACKPKSSVVPHDAAGLDAAAAVDATQAKTPAWEEVSVPECPVLPGGECTAVRTLTLAAKNGFRGLACYGHDPRKKDKVPAHAFPGASSCEVLSFKELGVSYSCEYPWPCELDPDDHERSCGKAYRQANRLARRLLSCLPKGWHYIRSDELDSAGSSYGVEIGSPEEDLVIGLWADSIDGSLSLSCKQREPYPEATCRQLQERRELREGVTFEDCVKALRGRAPASSPSSQSASASSPSSQSASLASPRDPQARCRELQRRRELKEGVTFEDCVKALRGP